MFREGLTILAVLSLTISWFMRAPYIHIKVSSSCLFISDVCGVNFVMSGIAETTHTAPSSNQNTKKRHHIYKATLRRPVDRYKYIVGFIYLLFMYMSPVIIWILVDLQRKFINHLHNFYAYYKNNNFLSSSIRSQRAPTTTAHLTQRIVSSFCICICDRLTSYFLCVVLLL